MRIQQSMAWVVVFGALLGGSQPAFGDVAPPNQKPKKDGCAIVANPPPASTAGWPLVWAALLALRRRR